jgi:hypothetical protein
VTRTQVIVVVTAVVCLGVGGNIGLLVQEARERIRTRGWNTKLLRGLSVISATVIVGTAFVSRPWYWDLAVAGTAATCLYWVLTFLRLLWRVRPPSIVRAVGLATPAVLAGVVLLGLGGVAAVLDVASLTSAAPMLAYHGGGRLRSPELDMVFWGPEWQERDLPTVRQAVAFQLALPESRWAQGVTSGGFGVSNFESGGCWIDPTAPTAGTAVPGTGSAAFRQELAAVFGGRHGLRPCPGSRAVSAPTALSPDAVVAMWLPATVPFEIGGVAEHGSVSWPGHPSGLVVAGLPGGYAYWGLPSCAQKAACAALPPYAPPTYALSHELLEAATNPYGEGWYAPGPLSWTARYVLANGPPALFGVYGHPSYPGEVADLCEPGSLLVRGRVLTGRLDPSEPLPVAAFYAPRRGCRTP